MTARLLYFAASITFVTLAFLALAHFEARRAARQADEQRVETIARAVAFTSVMESEREDAQAEGLTQRLVLEAQAKEPGLSQILVLKGTKLLAHTDEARAGRRLNPESLADKRVYDAFQSLKATVRKNLEERERRADFDVNAYPETELERDPETGVFIVSVPAKSEGDMTALVRVKSAEKPPALMFPVMVLVFGLAALVLGALLVLKLKGALLYALTSVVLLAALGLEARALLVWRDAVRTQHAAYTADTTARLAQAGLLAAPTTAQERTRLFHELSMDDAGRPSRGLVAVRSATVTPALSATVAAARQDFSSNGYVVSFAKSAFEAGQAQDRRDILLWAILFGALGLLLSNLGLAGLITRGAQAVHEHRSAYAYLAPAMVGMLVLVFVPVVFGIALGFMDRDYNEWGFAGLRNYIKILSDFNVSEPTNFYFTLVVTVLWTFSNVSLHVGIGLFFALLLNDPMLKARGVFRVLLIVPWAIPNYITALIWKGMFHKQFGAINFLLEALGLEPVAWFQSFWPAFFTNLSTNVWLGFPFMMVVSLGALQSIPADLYEAAIVDGASRWQRFKRITLPLLMPALVPAVIVGTVWTFNMFNIIYLVSGGAPNGATDILITEAFRWAFERDRYGYAAAYSTIIFVILLVFTLITNRVTGATKGAFD